MTTAQAVKLEANLKRPAAFEGIPVIDVDTHVSEWADLWTSRAPAKYKDRVPQMKEYDVPGYGRRRTWVIDGDKWLGTFGPNCTIRPDGSKIGDFDEFTRFGLDEIHPASHDVKSRIEYMDGAGIHAQIAYPNVLGFGGQKSFAVDPELRLVSTQIYNDAMAEMQAESGNRIYPMALLPWWDIKEAVKEAERCHAMGLRGVNTNSDPQSVDLPDLGQDYWHPLWDLCSDKGMPVNFHIGASDESATWFGSGTWPTFNSNQKLAFGSTMMFLSNARVLSNMFVSRFLEKFPKLNFVSVESGIGWLPFILETLEYQMDEAGIKYDIRPLDLFRRQFYACAWFEQRDFVQSARSLGIDNVMWETDFPHPTCLYPDALGFMAETAEQFTPEERRKVFGGNAARIYNIPTN